MKVTLNWLREFVPIDLALSDLCDCLTMGGLEVEAVEERGADIAGVLVAEIVSLAPHPGADRLTLCHLRTGEGETVQVVCGATNMKAGDRVAYAPPGTTLPGGARIESAVIRGRESAGMLCSEAELGLCDESEGILILGSAATLGGRVGALLGVEDAVLEIGVTPNRGDCLSVLGIAREIAVLTGRKLSRYRMRVREQGAPAADWVKVRIDDPAGCGRYAARVVRGLRVAPSPRWLQQRLLAVGLRPINNLVDVTNFVMIERGQPLHAFDQARLAQPEIVVRRARPGEKMRTLDGVDRTLVRDDLLITAGDVPVAVAGVIGGADSEVADTTTSVLLEAAWFDPASIRRTARQHDIHSEAAFRFERTTDIAGVPGALDRAATLLVECAGGQVAPGIVDVYPGAQPSALIHVRVKRVGELLGVPVGRAQVSRILKSLGSDVTAGPKGSLAVTVPCFRADLSREIDIVEEVARVVGYDEIPATMPAVAMTAGVVPARILSARRIRRLLAGYGLHEAIGMSFASPRINELFPGLGSAGENVKINNPLGRENSQLRRSLLGNLVEMARANYNQGAGSIGGFSIGKVFWRDSTPREAWRLSGLLGGARPEMGLGEKEEVGFAHVKGIAEAVIDVLRVREEITWHRMEDAVAWHPGKSARAEMRGELIGIVGTPHPRIEDELDVGTPIWLFEFDLEKLLAYVPRELSFRPLPRYPAVVRDVALVMDEGFAADQVIRFIRGQRHSLIEEVMLFDQYRGSPIPEGKKSLAYSISYRAPDRTLTDGEVNAVHADLVKRLGREFSVELR